MWIDLRLISWFFCESVTALMLQKHIKCAKCAKWFKSKTLSNCIDMEHNLSYISFLRSFDESYILRSLSYYNNIHQSFFQFWNEQYTFAVGVIVYMTDALKIWSWAYRPMTKPLLYEWTWRRSLNCWALTGLIFQGPNKESFQVFKVLIFQNFQVLAACEVG